MLCPEYKAPWAVFSISLEFIRLCSCLGRATFQGLESCSSDKHSQLPLILWPQTHEDAVAHPSCRTVLTNGKKQMVELLWTHSVQAFIRRQMLKSPRRREGKEVKKKYKMRGMKMLNQGIMWHDAFWQKLPVYIATEVQEKHCKEQKQHWSCNEMAIIHFCNYFDIFKSKNYKHCLVAVYQMWIFAGFLYL